MWEDHSSEFRSKLDNLLKPSDIDPEKVNDHQPGRVKTGSNVQLLIEIIVWTLLCFGWTCVFDRLPGRQGSASNRFQNLYLGRYCLSSVGYLPIPDHGGLSELTRLS